MRDARPIDHLRRDVRRIIDERIQRIGPIGERSSRAAGPVWVEVTQAVADRDPHLVAVDAGQRGQDIDRGVRDQGCPVIGQQRSLPFEEIQQVGHLFEVGRHVRVVAPKVHIVELDMDDVRDAIAELAVRIALVSARLLCLSALTGWLSKPAITAAAKKTIPLISVSPNL